jgi:hypothetical protein
MLPTAKQLLCATLKIFSINFTVVVLPFVPVTPIMSLFWLRYASSSSLITGVPFSFASLICSLKMLTEGFSTIKFKYLKTSSFKLKTMS